MDANAAALRRPRDQRRRAEEFDLSNLNTLPAATLATLVAAATIEGRCVDRFATHLNICPRRPGTFDLGEPPLHTLVYLRIRRIVPLATAHWLMDGGDAFVGSLLPLLR